MFESGGETESDRGGKPRRRRRLWIVGVAVFCGIVLLMLLRDRMETGFETVSQYRFEELVDSGQIVHATINYDTQNAALNEVVGRYYKTQDGVRVEMPFRTKVRLTDGLERKLLSLPQFEPHQPNTVLMGVVWSLLPFVIIGLLVWFFFVRQIKTVAKAAPSGSELQLRTAEQQNRLDGILDKWEEQANRMDAVLDKMERDKSDR